MTKRKNQKRRNKRYQVNNRRLRAKAQYKDTIFRMLYRDKENLLSLYNAVNDRDYKNPDEFLMKNRAEVIKVSIYEYDKEFEEKKLRKAEYEAGRQDGIEIGRQDGIEIGRKDGIEIGRKDGIEIGRQDGIEIGRMAGIKAGEKNILQKLIKKRLSKGMTLEEIADDLDEDVALIRMYMEECQE